MQLPKCQCQPNLDSVLRRACVNDIGKLLTYCYILTYYLLLFNPSCLHDLMSELDYVTQ